MKIKLAVLGFLALAIFTLVRIGNSATAPFAKVRDLTVLISSEDFGGVGRGTGILIDPTHVLTCAHIVSHSDGDPEILIYTYPLGKVFKGKVDAMDGYDDLAILVLDSSAPFKTAPVFQEDVKEGDSLTVIGNALGAMKWFITKGCIAQITGRYLMTDALVNPGNSGGPWVNEAGEVIGLTDWRIGPQEHIPGLAGGVPAKVINKMLTSYRNRDDMKEVLRAILGGN